MKMLNVIAVFQLMKTIVSCYFPLVFILKVAPKEKDLLKPSLLWVMFLLSWRNLSVSLVQKLLADLSLYSGPTVLG